MQTVRRLTDRGRAAFREWIGAGAVGDPPCEMLAGPGMSEPMHAEVAIEKHDFASRYELGAYLAPRLEPLGAGRIAFDAGLWDWLTLFWFDAIAPRNSTGTRRLHEMARYSQNPGSRRWSRHVVRMSWLSVHSHGEHARYFLSTPLERHTDVLEQIAGRQEVFGSTAAVALGERLYWDAKKQKLRKGAGGKAAGSPRRLSRFMRQIRMTYDPETMSEDQMLAMLPSEFARWTKPYETSRTPAKQRNGVISRLFGSAQRT